MDGWMTDGWRYDELHDLDSRRASTFSSAPPAGVSAGSFSSLVPGIGSSPSDQPTLSAGSFSRFTSSQSPFASSRLHPVHIFIQWTLNPNKTFFFVIVVLSRGRLTKYKVLFPEKHVHLPLALKPEIQYGHFLHRSHISAAAAAAAIGMQTDGGD